MTPRTHRQGSEGFTLIEVMVVVAIIGLLTSLSIVGYQAVTRNARTNGEADTLSQFLKNARLRAVSTGCPHVVRYEVPSAAMAAGTMTIYRKSPCTLTTAGLVQNTSTAPVDVVVNTYVTTPNMVVTASNAAGLLTGKTYYVGFATDGLPISGYYDTALNGVVGAASLVFKARAADTYSRTLTISGAGDVASQ